MEPNAETDVTIIIPTRNEENNIRTCLDAVFNQQTHYLFEVIVIDSGSTDRTVSIVNRFPKVKLLEIPPETFGHGKTRNLGAETAKGNILVFLNADALPVDSLWLDTLLEPFSCEKDKKEKIAGVFSRHIPKPGCHLYMARDILSSMPDKPGIRNHAGPMDLMIFSTVSCAIRRGVWQQFPFDPHIAIAEDQHWGNRILEHGFSLSYQPSSRVYHSHNYNPRQLYEVKYKMSAAAPRFKNRFTATTMGFILIVGGMLLKIAADTWYILFLSPSSPGKRLSLSQKREEIKIAASARIVSFWGRFKGWRENLK